MKYQQDEIRKIWFIDKTTKKEQYILTNQILWNEDRTIAVAKIQFPTETGIKSQEFQVSDEDIITIDTFEPVETIDFKIRDVHNFAKEPLCLPG